MAHVVRKRLGSARWFLLVNLVFSFVSLACVISLYANVFWN